MSKKIFYDVRFSYLYSDGFVRHCVFLFWDLSQLPSYLESERHQCKGDCSVVLDYIHPYYADSDYSAEACRSGELYLESVKCSNLLAQLEGGD